MTTLLSLALYAALFYVMMRYGCGAHMSDHHRHDGHKQRDQAK
jgi:hypothetical protein